MSETINYTDRKKYRNKSDLQVRAKNKVTTAVMMGGLVRIPDSPLRKSYYHTYDCCRNIVQEGKKLKSRYCNSRWCIVCNRIRTGKLIDGYLPVLSEIKDKYFVTLTIPNIGWDELRDTIAVMLSKLKQIRDAYRKRGKSMRGIRKMEVTYNSENKNFHPHFHILVSGSEAAWHLHNEWLKKFPEATRAAQDVRPATDGAIKELFKYFTKLMSKHAKYKNGRSKKATRCDTRAMDKIFCSMYGRRVFQPMGVKKLISEDVEDTHVQEYLDIPERDENETVIWGWDEIFNDWLDDNTGELLSDVDIGETDLQKLRRKLIE